MTTKSLIFTFWLLTPGLLLAQTGQAPAPARPPAQRGQLMYEDIEVMRRIINRKLGTWPSLIALNQRCTACHATSGAAFGDFSSDGKVDLFVANDPHAAWLNQSLFSNPHNLDPHASLAHWLNTEGVYLKGHGIVYTLTLPPAPRVARPQAKKVPSKPLTEWERTRRQIRGDNEDSQELAALESKQVEAWMSHFQGENPHLWLTETIVKILAENGQHLSQLPENETLTVAITFRDTGQLKGLTNQNAKRGTLEAWGAQSDEGEAMQSWNVQQGDAGLQSWQNLQTPLKPGEGGGGANTIRPMFQKASTPGGGGGDKPPSSIRDFELLGDLHLRQGKAREAIRTYQQALNLNPEPKQAAAIYRKIAQADLALEDDAGAKKALEMAQELLAHQPMAAMGNAAKTKTGGSAAKPQAASPMVSKLIISAPKRLLDQVAAGKVGFHDFEKQVTVDYVGLSTVETKDNKPTPTNSK
jgi:tetratricopeptide (TPR) repeat protein